MNNLWSYINVGSRIKETLCQLKHTKQTENNVSIIQKTVLIDFWT